MQVTLPSVTLNGHVLGPGGLVEEGAEEDDGTGNSVVVLDIVVELNVVVDMSVVDVVVVDSNGVVVSNVVGVVLSLVVSVANDELWVVTSGVVCPKTKKCILKLICLT